MSRSELIVCTASRPRPRVTFLYVTLSSRSVLSSQPAYPRRGIDETASVLDFHLFADDTNLFYSNKSLSVLEHIVNVQLDYKSIWLACDQLSLNIDKTNFTIFDTPQNKKTYNLKIYISNKDRKLEKHIKFLGVYIDSHLNWKHRIPHNKKGQQGHWYTI